MGEGGQHRSTDFTDRTKAAFGSCPRVLTVFVLLYTAVTVALKANARQFIETPVYHPFIFSALVLFFFLSVFVGIDFSCFL